MQSSLIVHPLFEDVWPLAADHLHERWTERKGRHDFARLDADDGPLTSVVDEPETVTHLVSLGVPIEDDALSAFSSLEEAFVMTDSMYDVDEAVAEALETRGVTAHRLDSEGFWSQSVAEFALGLTIDTLRQIPRKHGEMITSHDPWDLDQLHNEVPGARGHQFADDPAFVNGTVAGKRVRIVGVGNIGSRYADFTDDLGADVAAYDPFADEPCFHRSGADRVQSIESLVQDADIFAPMVPLTDATHELVTRDHIESLPEGALVVLTTRAPIVDVAVLRERVLADELALAADVWDEEPLPLDDPLLGRHNVVHTPHIAGRTRDANREWAETVSGLFTHR